MDYYQKIYDREYKEVYTYLRSSIDRRRLSRHEMNILQLLNNYVKLTKGGVISFNDKFRTNSPNIFEQIQSKLKVGDYDNLIPMIEEALPRAKEKEEYETYILILEDMKELEKDQDIRVAQKELDIKLKQKLETIVEIKEKDLDDLTKIIEERLKFEEENDLSTWYDKILLNITDTIRLSLTSSLYKDNFERFTEGKTTEDIVINCLEYGDYITAFKYVNKVDYKTELPNLNYYYMLNIKKLLGILNRSLKKETQEPIKTKLDLDPNIIVYLFFEKCNGNLMNLCKLLRDDNRLFNILENDFGKDIYKLNLIK